LVPAYVRLDLQLLLYGADQHAAAIEQWMKPTGALLVGVARDQDQAVGPASDKTEGIVYAVGVGKAVPFCDPVSFPAGSQVVVGSLQSASVERQLDVLRSARALAEAIAVA
jgi:hypothetical protein